MLLDGCHEGKHTPRLTEVKCPQCGEWVDVFVLMGGRPAKPAPWPRTRNVGADMCWGLAVLRVIMRGEGSGRLRSWME